MSDIHAGQYREAVRTLEEAHREGVRAFARWFAKSWTITREEWRRDFADPPPDGDWFAGYNAGVASAADAVEHFLSEEGRT